MRILHVNKFLYRRGGAEAYMLDLAALQRNAGHEVEFFAAAHPDNVGSRYARHFPGYIELNPPPASPVDRARAAGRVLYFPAARRGIEATIEAFRPDVVHLHNIYHHLSPSVLRPLARRGIPTVMTLHDYKLACPTYRFLANGELCVACLGGRFHHAVLKRCNEGSLSASALNAVELTLHTYGRAYDPVHRFVCPSRFIQRKMEQAGVFPARLRWLPNFVAVRAIAPADRPGAGVVYAGRLSREKGVDVLIRAAAVAGARVDVAGDGPERPRLGALAAELGVPATFHGRLDERRLHDLLRGAAAVAVPSVWYENQPLAVLEAFACGVPVIGTALGGIPELIEPGADGLLVPPGDVDALAAAVASLVGDPPRAHGMGRRARAKAEASHAPERHLDGLTALYEEAASAVGIAG